MAWPVILFVGALLAALPAQELERAIAAAEALGARTGVAVIDASGKVVFRHRATEAFAPVSNMKLLTAAAVVQGLGSDHRFVTRFVLQNGRLVVHASGDPNWITGTAHSPELVFGELAAVLQRRGIQALRGIDLEAGPFTGPLRPATWPQDQLWTTYCAPTGPFVLEQGTFAVRIAAGGNGSAAVSLAAPLAGLPLRGAIDVIDTKKGAVYSAIDVGDAVTLRGKFYRRAAPVTAHAAVRDPSVWYAAALRGALADAGITIAADAPDTGAEVAVHAHTSGLSTAILRMLEDSSNFDAEQCLRVLGAKASGDGSLAGGVAALHAQLERQLATWPDGVVLTDGSGLSKQNRLTPGLLVAVLQTSLRGPGGALLRESLPVAGKSGTLADRFEGTDLVGAVRAKTGWIRGASALSGLVERRDGGTMTFAILMNYDPKKNGLNDDLKRLQERMVSAIRELGPDR